MLRRSVEAQVILALLNNCALDQKAFCASFDTTEAPLVHLFLFNDCALVLLNSQSRFIPASSVVALYLETTCSGSISDAAYQSLACLEESADQSDQKLIQHLKSRVLQGSISVITPQT